MRLLTIALILMMCTSTAADSFCKTNDLQKLGLLPPFANGLGDPNLNCSWLSSYALEKMNKESWSNTTCDEIRAAKYLYEGAPANVIDLFSPAYIAPCCGGIHGMKCAPTEAGLDFCKTNDLWKPDVVPPSPQQDPYRTCSWWSFTLLDIVGKESWSNTTYDEIAAATYQYDNATQKLIDLWGSPAYTAPCCGGVHSVKGNPTKAGLNFCKTASKWKPDHLPPYGQASGLWQPEQTCAWLSLYMLGQAKKQDWKDLNCTDIAEVSWKGDDGNLTQLTGLLWAPEVAAECCGDVTEVKCSRDEAPTKTPPKAKDGCCLVAGKATKVPAPSTRRDTTVPLDFVAQVLSAAQLKEMFMLEKKAKAKADLQ